MGAAVIDVISLALARKYGGSTPSSGNPTNPPALQLADLVEHNNSDTAHPGLREFIGLLLEYILELEEEAHSHGNAGLLNAITQTPATQEALNSLANRIAVLEQPIPMRGEVYEALVPPSVVFNMHSNFSLPQVGTVVNSLNWPLQIAGNPQVSRQNGVDGRGQLHVTVNANWQGVDILHNVLNAHFFVGDRLIVRGRCVEANHMLMNVDNSNFRPILWNGAWSGGEANVAANGRFEMTTGFLTAAQRNLIIANQPQGLRIRGLAETATFIIEDIIWERPQNRTMLQLLGILAAQVT